MRVIIVGGGSVGKSIARDLVKQDHEVTIIDLELYEAQSTRINNAVWLSGDACSPEVLEKAGATNCDVMVAATGDDRVNLVSSMMAKTAYSIPKIVARINHPKNEYLFDASWGIDHAVSMPNAITSLIEDKVLDDEMVQVYHLNNTNKAIFKYRLGDEFKKKKITKDDFLESNQNDIELISVVRGDNIISVSEDFLLESGDELFIIGDVN